MTDKLIIELGTVATIAQSEDLLKECREVAILGRNVSVDASQVEKVDTSVLQLMVSLKKSLEAEGKKLSWLNPSNALLDAAKAVALHEHLELTN